MTLHEKWEHINHRLRMLDAADQEEEAGLLSEAYERLIRAYQEAREINDELEELLKNTLMNQLSKVSWYRNGEVSLPKIFF